MNQGLAIVSVHSVQQGGLYVVMLSRVSLTTTIRLRDLTLRGYLETKTKLEPDVKGRIIGVQTQMLHYNTLFGFQLSKKILKITDNLGRTLQHQAMSVAKGQAVAELTVCTLKGMRTEESFALFFFWFCWLFLHSNQYWSSSALPAREELLKGTKLALGKHPIVQL